MTNDLDLLQQYARQKSEQAFSALVNRHLNLVHSAALRQVRSTQLAEEVAQSVFTDLARNAHRLAPDTVLTAWLYQVTRRTAIDVVRREARRQLREQIATEMNAMNATTDDWTHIEPLLDEAMSALDETDRAAVLLRYFENKSLREVGQTLGTTDDAAQKRVSRAVERLREFLAKRGVTVGAGGLVVVISTNAVQAAPVGLALTISTTAVLTGTTLATTATVTATKAIAMTALQKTVVTATIAVLAGAGIYEARQTSQLREQVETLQQQQAPLTYQVRHLQTNLADATNRLADLFAENARLMDDSNQTELLRLRGEIGVLAGQASEAKQNLATALSYEAKFRKDEGNSVDAMKYLSLAMHEWALDHNNSFATNLLQLTNELANSFTRLGNSFARNGVSLSSFDFLNDGSVTRDHAKVVILRERFARQSPDGTWRRIYGFADGRVITAITADGNFDAWERVNTDPPPPRQN